MRFDAAKSVGLHLLRTVEDSTERLGRRATEALRSLRLAATATDLVHPTVDVRPAPAEETCTQADGRHVDVTQERVGMHREICASLLDG